MSVNEPNHISAAEQKRPRVNLGSYKDSVIPSDLVYSQLSSYRDFLQKDVAHADRELMGLHEAFSSVFPMKSSSGTIHL